MDFDLWEKLQHDAKRLELERNAKGKTLIECEQCGGTGLEREGYTDYDGNGSFWVPSINCKYCFMGFKEVPCTKEQKIAALEKLLEEAKNE